MIILGNAHVGLLKVSNISRVRKRAKLSLHITECVSMLYATNMLFKNLFHSPCFTNINSQTWLKKSLLNPYLSRMIRQGEIDAFKQQIADTETAIVSDFSTLLSHDSVLTCSGQRSGLGGHHQGQDGW